MTFSKLRRRGASAAIAVALALGAAPAAGAAAVTTGGAPSSCVLIVDSAERPFVNARLNAQAEPFAPGYFQYHLKTADVPALKARIPADGSDIRATNLRFLLSQCESGRSGLATLQPPQPGYPLLEGRETTLMLDAAVALESLIFGSLPTLTDVLR